MGDRAQILVDADLCKDGFARDAALPLDDPWRGACW
jgi:hypothetical protein